MGIFESIKNNITRSKEKQYIKISRNKLKNTLKEYTSSLNITEQLTQPTNKSGKGVIRPPYDIFRSQFLKGGEIKDINKWEKYRKAYDNISIVAGSINALVDNSIKFVQVIGKNEKYVEELRKFIEKFDSDQLFKNIARQLLIYGNTFIELVKDESGIADLKVLPPVYMFVNRNEYGNFTKNQKDAYLQFLIENPTEPINFAWDEIAHFKYNQIGESAYGNSLIQPVVEFLHLKLESEANMAVIIDRYAAPLMHFKIGSPERPTNQKEVTQFSTDLEDIQADTELVTDDRVEGVVIGSQKEVINLAPALEYYVSQIIAGTGVPPVSIGIPIKTDRATAEIQLDVFDRKSKSLQNLISNITEKQIFLRHLQLVFGEDIKPDEVPELVWGEPEQRQEREDMKILIELANAGVITPQKANELLPDEYHETLPKIPLNNPETPKGNSPSPGEPPLKRIKTARDKRVPKDQRGNN